MADNASHIEARQDAQGHDVLGDELSGDTVTVSEQTAPGRGSPIVAEDERPSRLRRLRMPLLLLAPVIVIAGVLFFYLHGGRYEQTDNAYLQSGLVSISPDVAGRVISVEVHNNQAVRKGDLLFRIDPAPYQAAVDEAQAQLAAATAEVGSLRANYGQGQSELAAAQQRVLFADREAARQKSLVAEGISSQAQYEQALLAARTAAQAIQTVRQQNASVAASLSGNVNAPPASQPAVQRARAALDRAKLNLGYTVVRAPQDGTLAKVDQLQVGDYVTAARPVFTLAGNRLWVEANFKENQLRYMRIGQPATIRIDAFPDLELSAHLSSFSPGTGNSFSVLPAENATGNWVKVVQRLPVELTIDRAPTEVPLHAGLSVEVTLDNRAQAASVRAGHDGPQHARPSPAGPVTQRYPDATTRRFITGAVMAATVMNSLDSTIANVALPHMQGSVAASADQITWVLTSYIVAAAICTPLTGWLAGRFGRKRLMLFSIVGFTIASGLCGIATSLGELVGFRLLQGVFGAALVPMSQAILLDINPPERHGPAMSIWGMGAILGPIIGPALGGWLTDNYNWRWVFFINLPIGIAAFAGLWFFLSESKMAERVKFDLFGFAMLALGIASLQIMLDRGQQLDWFSSLEICIEAVAAVAFFYLFIVHTLTARLPFINLALFTDRNFVSASIFGFFLGVLIFAVLALLPPMLEALMGYPVVLTGLVTAPRGMGTMISMIVVGQLIKRVDPRILIGVGLALAAWSTYEMSGFSLGMDERLVITTGFVQGIGTGLIFVPLSTVAFATLNPQLRNEGAAMFTLIRNIGSAIGISVLQFMTVRNASTVHARLVEGVRPDNPVVARSMPDLDFSSIASMARMNGEITRQAAMVSYIDSFYALFVVTLIVAPLILIMRPPRKGVKAPTMHMD